MLTSLIGYVVWKLDNIKRKYLTRRNCRSVNNPYGAFISGNVEISCPKSVYVGRNTYINGGYLVASENSKIVIGDNCLISYDVHIRTGMHIYADRNQLISKQGSREADIVIGNDVWIGFGAQILSGVHIADGCVIGAGAIVTKDTEPYGVYVGVPARKIKER